MIENQQERKLDRDKPAGAIFALKNMGWSNRQEVEFKGSLANVNLELLPDDLLARIVAWRMGYLRVRTDYRIAVNHTASRTRGGRVARKHL